MPIGAQPPERRGTVGHAYSALTLRLILAAFGLVTCAVLAVLLLRTGFDLLGWITAALAVIAAIDLVVIQLRRRTSVRSRAEHDPR